MSCSGLLGKTKKGRSVLHYNVHPSLGGLGLHPTKTAMEEGLTLTLTQKLMLRRKQLEAV